jgi:hypothetical protein
LNLRNTYTQIRQSNPQEQAQIEGQQMPTVCDAEDATEMTQFLASQESSIQEALFQARYFNLSNFILSKILKKAWWSTKLFKLAFILGLGQGCKVKYSYSCIHVFIFLNIHIYVHI